MCMGEATRSDLHILFAIASQPYNGFFSYWQVYAVALENFSEYAVMTF